MCCLFITSSSPVRPTSPSLNVFESRVPSPRALRPASHVPALARPTSQRPRVPRPRVPESHVPTSRRPTSPRPLVPRPGVSESSRPKSHVPVPLLVTALIYTDASWRICVLVQAFFWSEFGRSSCSSLKALHSTLINSFLLAFISLDSLSLHAHSFRIIIWMCQHFVDTPRFWATAFKIRRDNNLRKTVWVKRYPMFTIKFSFVSDSKISCYRLFVTCSVMMGKISTRKIFSIERSFTG